jgi:hypothetical protein
MIDLEEYTQIAAQARAAGMTMHEAETFALSVLLATAYSELPTQHPLAKTEAMEAILVAQRELMARPVARLLLKVGVAPAPSMERGPSLGEKGTQSPSMAESPRVEPVHRGRGARPHAR